MRDLSQALALAVLMTGGMTPLACASAADAPAIAHDAGPPAAAVASARHTAHLGLFSQYAIRGITYSREKPAIQGGFEYGHPSGWYAGFWASNVSGVAINNASLETDPYGGYAGSIGDLGYDVGFWHWTFIGGKFNVSRVKYDTLELYAGVTYKFLNVKYWHELSDYFGYNSSSARLDLGVAPNGSSKGSHYLEGNLNFDLPGGLLLGFHAGRQTIENYEQFDFTDYKIGIDKDFGKGYLASVAYSDTNANAMLYTDIQGLNTGRSKWLWSIKRTF